MELAYALAGLKIDEFSRAKMDATTKDLIDGKRSGPFMPQLTIKPSSLENNEEDLIIHEKKKGISNFHPNFMY